MLSETGAVVRFSSRLFIQIETLFPGRSALFCLCSIQETTGAKEIPHFSQVDFCVIEKSFDF
jgi:hypothetical protein